MAYAPSPTPHTKLTHLKASPDQEDATSLRKVYEPELKRAAVHAYLEEGMTRKEVVDYYDIASVSTFKKWVIAYKRDGEAALDRKSYAIDSGGRSRPLPTYNPLDPGEGYRIRRENARLVSKLGR